MEPMVEIGDWNTFPVKFRENMRNLRSVKGDQMVIRDNMFAMILLNHGVLRTLTVAEKKIYGMPFEIPGENRRPPLSFVRNVPFMNDDEDNLWKWTDKGPQMQNMIDTLYSYVAWLNTTTKLPKLWINAEPGIFSTLAVENPSPSSPI
jgi:hypothetical protein